VSKLIHPELSYQVRGALFDVYNVLGPMLKEEYYEEAIALGLKKRGIACESEKAIQRACHHVHFTLGPGFLHQVYRRATMIELRRSGLDYDYIKQLPVEYKGQPLGYQDVRVLVVEDKVLLATFALSKSSDAAAEQLKAHLRRLGLKLGLLANFHDTRLKMTPVRVK
jgi:GxxExxY protein